ncbi:MAG: hypothetical protein JST75_18065 [Bacteroidetes bacterium]|nr:hypothetical protein [Bacteroidota bacterium]
MNIKRNFFLLPFLMTGCLFIGCQQNQHSSDNKSKSDSGANSTNVHSETIPENRKEVKKEAVASYKEKTDNPLNDWYFSVRLFETEKTFDYVLKMQFEEIRGEDTLTLPNFGIQPKPELRKGKDKYSCIVGFIDRENKFREYKLVYVKDGTKLKLVTLNHYSVVSVDK